MKKGLLLTSLLLLFPAQTVLAQNEDRIKEIESQITSLQEELSQLKGDESTFGQTLDFQDVLFTINDAYFTTYTYNDGVVHPLLIIKYTFKNNSNDVKISDYNFAVYADDVKLEAFPYDGNESQQVQPGKSVNVTFAYELTSQDHPKKAELFYQEANRNIQAKDTIKLDLTNLKTVPEE